MISLELRSLPHFFWHLHKALSDPKLQALDPNNPDTPSLWDIRLNSKGIGLRCQHNPY